LIATDILARCFDQAQVCCIRKEEAFSGTVGLVKRTTETDLEKLWVEHNSRVVEEWLYFNERFVLIFNSQKKKFSITFLCCDIFS
jgi:hypothetical protein